MSGRIPTFSEIEAAGHNVSAIAVNIQDLSYVPPPAKPSMTANMQHRQVSSAPQPNMSFLYQQTPPSAQYVVAPARVQAAGAQVNGNADAARYVVEREIARFKKDWARADEIHAYLQQIGVNINSGDKTWSSRCGLYGRIPTFTEIETAGHDVATIMSSIVDPYALAAGQRATPSNFAPQVAMDNAAAAAAAMYSSSMPAYMPATAAAPGDSSVPEPVRLVVEREIARFRKEWARADQLHARLSSIGVSLVSADKTWSTNSGLFGRIPTFSEIEALSHDVGAIASTILDPSCSAIAAAMVSAQAPVAVQVPMGMTAPAMFSAAQVPMMQTQMNSTAGGGLAEPVRLVVEREIARFRKDWQLADELQVHLQNMGVTLSTPDKTWNSSCGLHGRIPSFAEIEAASHDVMAVGSSIVDATCASSAMAATSPQAQMTAYSPQPAMPLAVAPVGGAGGCAGFPSEQARLVVSRESARFKKDWARADEIHAHLTSLGVSLNNADKSWSSSCGLRGRIPTFSEIEAAGHDVNTIASTIQDDASGAAGAFATKMMGTTRPGQPPVGNMQHMQ